ncbi:uncharacterized protein LOC127849270 [Dreissena polymorpha]|uniref:uncharacterized protein LOC127849270 n=1 Tax=Dreissena polymorpha TaxID=45954 RepID=UPI002265168E|nr:uncharacterized protein LOC127849270 [Dreissena polymorpha]
MEVTTERSKIMVNSTTKTSAGITTNGEKLEEVISLKYIGAYLSKLGTSTTKVRIRIAMATTAMVRMSRFWTSSSISFPNKYRFYKSIVVDTTQGTTLCARLFSRRAGLIPGETQEDPSQVTTHSTGDLSAAEQLTAQTRSATSTLPGEMKDEEDPLLELLREEEQTEQIHDLPQPKANQAAVEQRQPIDWPKTTDKRAWNDLDKELDAILTSTMRGPVDRKLKCMTTLVYTVAKERFGTKKTRRPKPQQTPNRRQSRKKQIRGELKSLNKAYKKASQEERLGLQELRDILRRELQTFRKAENARTARRRRAQKRAEFVSNPYKFSKQLLDKERSGQLETSMADIEEHLIQVHSDPDRLIPLGDCPRLEHVVPPTSPLECKEPSLLEVKEGVRKARMGLAPGPNKIPYKVYKMCPLLLRRLWNLLKVIWRKGIIPDEWLHAEGIFTPKEKNSKHISQFRTISLLNVAISQLIREAKVNKSDLTVVWLDLANAYGSIPHKLIESALQYYHIPEHIQGMINAYFSGMKLRFMVGEKMTAWQRLEKGIVTGCTISVVLFVMGMNLIINPANKETRGPKTSTGLHLPTNRGFMYDLTVTTQTHIQARWVLKVLEEAATWARMNFKSKKSRSLVIKRGSVTKRLTLQVQGEDIPSIMDSPIKCLGKWFDSSLSDKANVERIRSQLQEGLKQIDKSALPGKFKAWLFQNALLPRLMWPLMLYEIPTSSVECLERKISKHLRRWLGIPQSFTSIGLYGRSNQLQLPQSSLVEEFKVAKTRLVVTLKQSQDSSIRNAGIETRTGRKWSASQAVEHAEKRLQQKDIVGITAVGRQGLGSSKITLWSSAGNMERRRMVQDEVRAAEEEDRRAKAVAMGAQGAWTKWTTTERKLTWADIWSYEPLRIAFLLRSVYDLLPSPSNLHRWGLQDHPKCQLCDKTGTMEHILSSCTTALTQGRYRWSHDSVLQELADKLERERTKKRPRQKPQMIQFVKEGQKASKKLQPTSSVLDESESGKCLLT